jgi:hypothetical protein
MNTTSGVRPATVRRRGIAKTDQAGAAPRQTRAERCVLPEMPSFIIRVLKDPRSLCGGAAERCRGTVHRAARGTKATPGQRPAGEPCGQLGNAAADRDLGAAHPDGSSDATVGAVAGESGVVGTRSDRGAGHRLKIRSITAVTREVARAIAIRSPLLSTTLKISAAAGANESSADESPLRRRRSWASSTTTRGR